MTPIVETQRQDGETQDRRRRFTSRGSTGSGTSAGMVSSPTQDSSNQNDTRDTLGRHRTVASSRQGDQLGIPEARSRSRSPGTSRRQSNQAANGGRYRSSLHDSASFKATLEHQKKLIEVRELTDRVHALLFEVKSAKPPDTNRELQLAESNLAELDAQMKLLTKRAGELLLPPNITDDVAQIKALKAEVVQSQRKPGDVPDDLIKAGFVNLTRAIADQKREITDDQLSIHRGIEDLIFHWEGKVRSDLQGSHYVLDDLNEKADGIQRQYDEQLCLWQCLLHHHFIPGVLFMLQWPLYMAFVFLPVGRYIVQRLGKRVELAAAPFLKLGWHGYLIVAVAAALGCYTVAVWLWWTWGIIVAFMKAIYVAISGV